MEIFRLVLDGEPRLGIKSKVDAEGRGDALNTQEVIPVGCHLNLVDVLIGDIYGVSIAINPVHLHLLGCAVLQLYSKLEAEILKVVVGYSKER